MKTITKTERKEDNNFIALTSFLPIMVPIVKIVGNYCNLRCSYCFYNSEDQCSKTVMSKKVLENFLREYLKLFTGRLRFNWHGGEPLLAGLSFFKEIISLQKKYARKGQIIENTVQTNATLIDNNWARFFRENNFNIGVSLDGNRECHDRFRKDIKGEGTFNSVIRGIKILKENGISIGILQTLTRDNLPFLEKTFKFFVNELDVNQININFYRYNGNPRMIHQEVSNEELTNYFKDLISLWLFQNDTDLNVREIENFFAGIYNKQSSLCGFNGSCTAFFCVEHDGKIYPCDRVANEREFCFGDLKENCLEDILNGKKRFNWVEKANFLHSDCLKCEWKNACHNGCSDNRNNSGKYYFCTARKDIFSWLKKEFL
jgi:uncharacterized protein